MKSCYPEEDKLCTMCGKKIKKGEKCVRHNEQLYCSGACALDHE